MTATTTLPVLFATGNHAGRPAASAVGAGGLYSCTTHSLVYQTDGSTWTTWATLTGTGLSDPMTTRGDIIVRNSSNVTARLAIGSNGKVLQSDGTDISWQTPAGGGPLAVVAATSGDVSTNSSTFVDADATNLQITFTTPASGKVIVILSATMSPDSGGAVNGAIASWSLRESSSDIGPSNINVFRSVIQAATANFQFESVRIYMTGVSAGSHTYKWSHKVTGGATTLIKCGANNPALMEVWAA